MAWIEDGPVSTPPRSLTYLVAGVMVITAGIAGALGFRATLRDGAPSLLGGRGGARETQQTIDARPIVQLPVAQPVAVAKPASNALADAADKVDTNSLAAQTAAAQQIQAKPSKPAGNIDDILTSPSERPQAPAKPGADETPPGAPDPAKSEVPF